MFFYCTVYNSNFLFSIRCSAATTRRDSFLVFFFFKWRKHRPNADGIDTLVQWKLIDSYSMLNYWVGFERTVMLSEFHLWNRLNDTRTCRPRGREEQTRDWKSIQQVVTSFQSRGRCDGLRQQQGDRHSFIFSSHVNDFLSEWTPTLVLTTCHQRRRWGVRTAAAAVERKVNPPSSPPSSLSGKDRLGRRSKGKQQRPNTLFSPYTPTFMRPRVIVLSAGTQLPARLLLLAPAFPFCPLVLHPRFVSMYPT